MIDARAIRIADRATELKSRAPMIKSQRIVDQIPDASQVGPNASDLFEGSRASLSAERLGARPPLATDSHRERTNTMIEVRF
jgi:hypothetical protein